jgi:hypothetical protein
MSCKNIAASLIADICGEQAKSGTGARAIILNFNEVDKSLSSLTDNVIDSIVMKATKVGYSLTSIDDNGNLGEYSLVRGTYKPRWQHDVTGRLFTKDELTKTFMNNIVGSKVIIILENKEEGHTNATTNTGPGATKYEVYGWDSGLEVSEATGSTEIADGVVYQFKAGSPERSKEGSLPKSFFDTDLATTELALGALLGEP